MLEWIGGETEDSAILGVSVRRRRQVNAAQFDVDNKTKPKNVEGTLAASHKFVTPIICLVTDVCQAFSSSCVSISRSNSSTAVVILYSNSWF